MVCTDIAMPGLGLISKTTELSFWRCFRLTDVKIVCVTQHEIECWVAGAMSCFRFIRSSILLVIYSYIWKRKDRMPVRIPFIPMTRTSHLFTVRPLQHTSLLFWLKQPVLFREIQRKLLTLKLFIANCIMHKIRRWKIKA